MTIVSADLSNLEKAKNIPFYFTRKEIRAVKNELMCEINGWFFHDRG